MPPPSWKKLLEASFRGPGGQPVTHLPKLTFDQRLFEEDVDGRVIFRPRPDTVLLRLGHPLMRRAISILRRELWEGDKVRRWTVVGSRQQPYEAILVVWVLLTATNQLREPIHEEVTALPFVVEGGRLVPLDDRLWAELAREPLAPVPARELSLWQEHLAEYWLDYRRQVDKLLISTRQAEEKRVTGWLARWKERELKREQEAFAARLRELEEGRDVQAVAEIQRKLVRAQRRAAQLSLLAEEQAERMAVVERLERELAAATFELQTSHIQALCQRLERDRERVLTQVIPKRFALAHFDLHPVAVELRVRTHGHLGGER